MRPVCAYTPGWCPAVSAWNLPRIRVWKVRLQYLSNWYHVQSHLVRVFRHITTHRSSAARVDMCRFFLRMHPHMGGLIWYILLSQGQRQLSVYTTVCESCFSTKYNVFLWAFAEIISNPVVQRETNSSHLISCVCLIITACLVLNDFWYWNIYEDFDCDCIPCNMHMK